MLDMSATNNKTYGASFTSAVFEVGHVDYVLFSVTDLDDGVVTFQYNPGDGNWYTIDATELVTDAADILKVAILGHCQVRCVGDADVAGTELFIAIGGDNVRRV